MDERLNISLELGVEMADSSSLSTDVERAIKEAMKKAIKNSIRQDSKQIASNLGFEITKGQLNYMTDMAQKTGKIKDGAFTASTAFTRMGKALFEIDKDTLSGFYQALLKAGTASDDLHTNLEEIQKVVKSIDKLDSKVTLKPSDAAISKGAVNAQDVGSLIRKDSKTLKDSGSGVGFGQTLMDETKIRNEFYDKALDLLAKEGVAITDKMRADLSNLTSKQKLAFDETGKQIKIDIDYAIDKYSKLKASLMGTAISDVQRKEDGQSNAALGEKEYAVHGLKFAYTNDDIARLSDAQKEYSAIVGDIAKKTSQLKDAERTRNEANISSLTKEVDSLQAKKALYDDTEGSKYVGEAFKVEQDAKLKALEAEYQIKRNIVELAEKENKDIADLNKLKSDYDKSTKKDIGFAEKQVKDPASKSLDFKRKNEAEIQAAIVASMEQERRLLEEIANNNNGLSRNEQKRLDVVNAVLNTQSKYNNALNSTVDIATKEAKLKQSQEAYASNIDKILKLTVQLKEAEKTGIQQNITGIKDQINSLQDLNKKEFGYRSEQDVGKAFRDEQQQKITAYNQEYKAKEKIIKAVETESKSVADLVKRQKEYNSSVSKDKGLVARQLKSPDNQEIAYKRKNELDIQKSITNYAQKEKTAMEEIIQSGGKLNEFQKQRLRSANEILQAETLYKKQVQSVSTAVQSDIDAKKEQEKLKVNQTEYLNLLEKIRAKEEQLAKAKSLYDSDASAKILEQKRQLEAQLKQYEKKSSEKYIGKEFQKDFKSEQKKLSEEKKLEEEITNSLAKRKEEITKNNNLLSETLQLQKNINKAVAQGKEGTDSGKLISSRLERNKSQLSSSGESPGVGIKFNENGIITVERMDSAMRALGMTAEEVTASIDKYNSVIEASNAELVDEQDLKNLAKLKGLYSDLNKATVKLAELKRGGARRGDVDSQARIVNEINASINATRGYIQTQDAQSQASEIQADANRDLEQSMNSLNASSSRSKGLFASLTTEIERSIKNVYEYGIAWKIFSTTEQALDQAIQTVIDFDTATVELQKVTDLAGESLKAFTQNAFEVGGAIGRTGKEVLDATATFARAGFEANQALALSESALILTNVADGIDDVAEASSSLIAIMSGLGIGAENVTHIIDSLNEVSNRYAVDTNNLTEILKRVSGVLGQTGTSLEEALGLATGGFTTLRNAEMVASGLNMISQRMRGMEEDGEAIEGLVPKIEAAFMKYTNGTVSMIDKQNGGLRSTYDVLQDLSKVYNDLSDEARAYMNELIAGNRQNKVLVAIMQNWENVEGAVRTATNSYGSANEENQKYLNSIVGLSNQLVSVWQKVATSLNGDEVIKTLLGMAIAISEFVESAKVVPMVMKLLVVALPIATFALLIKQTQSLASKIMLFGNAYAETSRLVSLGMNAENINKMAVAMSGLTINQKLYTLSTLGLTSAQQQEVLVASGLSAEEARLAVIRRVGAASAAGAGAATVGFTEALKMNLAMLKAQAKAFIASPLGMATLIIAGVVAIIAVVDLLNVSLEEQKEAYEELTAEYDKNQQELEGVSAELKTVKDRLEELQAKGTLDIVEEAELQKLINVKSQLTEQLLLLEAINEVKGKEKASAAAKLYQKEYQPIAMRSDFDVMSQEQLAYMQANGVSGADTKQDIVEKKAQRYLDLNKKINTTWSERGALRRKEFHDLTQEEKKILETYDKEEKAFQDLAKELASESENLAKLNEGVKLNPDVEGAQEVINLYQLVADALMQVSDPEQYAQLKFDKILDMPGMERAKKELKELGAIGGVSQESINSYSGLGKAIEDAGFTSESFIATLNREPNLLDASAASAYDYAESLKTISETTDLIVEAQKEQNANGFVSSETFIELIKLGKEYTDVLFDENGALKLNSNEWKDVATAQKQKILADKELEKSILERTIKDQTKALESYKKALGGANSKFVGPGVLYSKNDLAELESGLEASQGSLDTLNREIHNIKSQMPINIVADLSSIDSANKSIQSMTEEFKEYKKITISTLKEMTSKYPQLEKVQNDYLSGLIDEKEVIKSFETAYKEDALAYINAQVQKRIDAGATEDEISKVYQSLMNSLGLMYQGDEKNFASLMNSHARLSAIAAKSVGDNWASVYGSLGKALEASLPVLKKQAQSLEDAMYSSFGGASAASAQLNTVMEQIKEIEAYSNMANEFSIKPISVGGGSSSKDSGQEDSKTKITDELEVLDKYLELQRKIQAVSNDISGIQAKMSSEFFSPNMEEYIQYINSERELINKRRDLNQEYLEFVRRNRDELQKELESSLSFEFVGEGDRAAISNYEELIKKATNALNEFISENRGEELSGKQLDAYNKRLEELQYNVDILKEKSQEFYDLQLDMIPKIKADIESYSAEIQNLSSKMLSSVNDLLSMTISMLKQQQSDAIKMQNDMKDAYREAYEQQAKQNDALRKQQDKAHEEAKDNLNDELEAARRRIQYQIDLLNLKEKERDYQRELAGKQKSVADIEGELLKIQFDDSAEAQKKRKELEESLYAKREDLEEFQHDRETELKQQALEDELKRIEELYKAKEDALDKDHEKQQEIQDALDEQNRINYENEMKRREDIIKKMQDDLNNELMWRQQAIALMNGKSDEYYQNLINWNSRYGTFIDSDVITKWNKAYEIIDGMDTPLRDVEGTINLLAQATNGWVEALGQVLEKFSQLNNVKQAPPTIWEDSVDEEVWEQVIDDSGNNNNGWSSGGNNGHYKQGDTIDFVVDKNPMKYFHDGGAVGRTNSVSKEFLKLMNLNSNEVPAILKNDEVVLNQEHQKNMLDKLSGLNLNANFSQEKEGMKVDFGDIIIQGSADKDALNKIEKIKKDLMGEFFQKMTDMRKRGSSQNLNLAGI